MLRNDIRWQADNFAIIIIITPPPVGGRGIVFARFLSLFLCLFFCQQNYEKTAVHEIFREVWSDHGTTWLNLGSIRINRSAGQRSFFVIWFDCGLLAVLCCHLATENVMKLLFLAFRYVAAGGGVCCASHHSLLLLFNEVF